MSAQYVNMTQTEQYEVLKSGLCILCGSKPIGHACFCRYCPTCTQIWKAPYRAEGIGGNCRVENCDDCLKRHDRAHPRLSHACQYTNCNYCSGRNCGHQCHKEQE